MSTMEPNSPTARANASATPDRIAGSRFGKTTRRKMAKRFAPSDAAASSMSRSNSVSTGCTVRTTNGSVTNKSAITTETRVKATLIPTGLPGPYSASSVNPATIVGRANGRSMSVLTKLLPGELVAHEHPRDRGSGDRVDQRDDDGDDERELDRRDRLGRGDRLPEAGEAPFVGLPDERREREEDDHGQVARDHPDS